MLWVTLSFSSGRVGAEGKMLLKTGMFVTVLSMTQLTMLQLVNGELDRSSQGQGMQLYGNFSIAGFFPLHYGDDPDGRLPALALCKE